MSDEKTKESSVVPVKKSYARPGQPTKYRPEYCEMLIEHMANGLSFETFGYSIGVSRDCVFEWAKTHPEFSDAKALAKDASFAFWEKLGVKGVWNGGKGEPTLNSPIYIFTMKNRFGWRDQPKEDPGPKQGEHKSVVIIPDNGRDRPDDNDDV